MHTPDNPLPEGAFREGEPPPPLPPIDMEPVEARGLAWMLVPLVVAALFGLLIGLATAATRVPAPGLAQRTLLEAAIHGAVVGAIAGGAIGVVIWVVFPYKNRNPHAPQEEPAKDSTRPS